MEDLVERVGWAMMSHRPPPEGLTLWWDHDLHRSFHMSIMDVNGNSLFAVRFFVFSSELYPGECRRRLSVSCGGFNGSPAEAAVMASALGHALSVAAAAESAF